MELILWIGYYGENAIYRTSYWSILTNYTFECIRDLKTSKSQYKKLIEFWYEDKEAKEIIFFWCQKWLL